MMSQKKQQINTISFDIQDYQAEVESTQRQFEQKHMVNWIVNNVVTSITPKQVRQREVMGKLKFL